MCASLQNCVTFSNLFPPANYFFTLSHIPFLDFLQTDPDFIGEKLLLLVFKNLLPATMVVSLFLVQFLIVEKRMNNISAYIGE